MTPANPALALFCSVKCPGSVILKLYDAVRALRDARVAVMGGFHSPMEQECLAILLRGTQPVIVCPVRPPKRLPAAWKDPIAEGRLTVLPSEATGTGRITAALAERRNEFVAARADALLVAHASAGGKTERLAADAIAAGKQVFTLADPANENLVALGAVPLEAGSHASDSRLLGFLRRRGGG